ncbi:MAG: hypothetical protein FWG03_05560 [Clostridiales bacterium]|nr:hypothetical protein [Clostridiales bacterium]
MKAIIAVALVLALMFAASSVAYASGHDKGSSGKDGGHGIQQHDRLHDGSGAALTGKPGGGSGGCICAQRHDCLKDGPCWQDGCPRDGLCHQHDHYQDGSCQEHGHFRDASCRQHDHYQDGSCAIDAGKSSGGCHGVQKHGGHH